MAGPQVLQPRHPLRRKEKRRGVGHPALSLIYVYIYNTLFLILPSNDSIWVVHSVGDQVPVLSRCLRPRVGASVWCGSKDKSPFHLIPSFRRSNSHYPNLHFPADCNSIFPLAVLFFCADNSFSTRVAVFRARQGCNPPWRLLTGMSQAFSSNPEVYSPQGGIFGIVQTNHAV